MIYTKYWRILVILLVLLLFQGCIKIGSGSKQITRLANPTKEKNYTIIKIKAPVLNKYGKLVGYRKEYRKVFASKEIKPVKPPKTLWQTIIGWIWTFWWIWVLILIVSPGAAWWIFNRVRGGLHKALDQTTHAIDEFIAKSENGEGQKLKDQLHKSMDGKVRDYVTMKFSKNFWPKK